MLKSVWCVGIPHKKNKRITWLESTHKPWPAGCCIIHKGKTLLHCEFFHCTDLKQHDITYAGFMNVYKDDLLESFWNAHTFYALQGREAINSQICMRPRLQIVFVLLFLNMLPTFCNGMCAMHIINISFIRTQNYVSARPFHSVLAAIESAAQKCRWCMPQTVAKRQMFGGLARIDRDLECKRCHWHEPLICSC